MTDPLDKTGVRPPAPSPADDDAGALARAPLGAPTAGSVTAPGRDGDTFVGDGDETPTYETYRSRLDADAQAVLATYEVRIGKLLRLSAISTLTYSYFDKRRHLVVRALEAATECQGKSLQIVEKRGGSHIYRTVELTGELLGVGYFAIVIKGVVRDGTREIPVAVKIPVFGTPPIFAKQKHLDILQQLSSDQIIDFRYYGKGTVTLPNRLFTRLPILRNKELPVIVTNYAPGKLMKSAGESVLEQYSPEDRKKIIGRVMYDLARLTREGYYYWSRNDEVFDLHFLLDDDLNVRWIDLDNLRKSAPPDRHAWHIRFHSYLGDLRISLDHYKAPWEAIEEFEKQAATPAPAPAGEPARPLSLQPVRPEEIEIGGWKPARDEKFRPNAIRLADKGGREQIVIIEARKPDEAVQILRHYEYSDPGFEEAIADDGDGEKIVFLARALSGEVLGYQAIKFMEHPSPAHVVRTHDLHHEKDDSERIPELSQALTAYALYTNIGIWVTKKPDDVVIDGLPAGSITRKKVEDSILSRVSFTEVPERKGPQENRGRTDPIQLTGVLSVIKSLSFYIRADYLRPFSPADIYYITFESPVDKADVGNIELTPDQKGAIDHAVSLAQSNLDIKDRLEPEIRSNGGDRAIILRIRYKKGKEPLLLNVPNTTSENGTSPDATPREAAPAHPGKGPLRGQRFSGGRHVLSHSSSLALASGGSDRPSSPAAFPPGMTMAGVDAILAEPWRQFPLIHPVLSPSHGVTGQRVTGSKGHKVVGVKPRWGNAPLRGRATRVEGKPSLVTSHPPSPRLRRTGESLVGAPLGAPNSLSLRAERSNPDVATGSPRPSGARDDRQGVNGLDFAHAQRLAKIGDAALRELVKQAFLRGETVEDFLRKGIEVLGRSTTIQNLYTRVPEENREEFLIFVGMQMATTSSIDVGALEKQLAQAEIPLMPVGVYGTTGAPVYARPPALVGK